MNVLKKHIFICENLRNPSNPKGCCAAKGGKEIKNALKVKLAEKGFSKLYRANSAGCLDACEYGAALVIYPQNIWYGGVTLADIEEIIEQSILKDNVLDRLLIKKISAGKNE